MATIDTTINEAKRRLRELGKRPPYEDCDTIYMEMKRDGYDITLDMVQNLWKEANRD